METQCFVTFPPFRAPAPVFFWLFLFSDLLSSSFLFSDSVHLFQLSTLSKFHFQFLFDYHGDSVWNCACQLLFSQLEVSQPQGWQPYSLCFALGIAKAPWSPPTVVLCCRHHRWWWQPFRRFAGMYEVVQVMFRFITCEYAVSGVCVCVRNIWTDVLSLFKILLELRFFQTVSQFISDRG